MLHVHRPGRSLRTEYFPTLPRSSTTGISIGYTNTSADDRISAHEIDELDCVSGYVGISYHYLISPSGRVELGRNPQSCSARGTHNERKHSIWVGIIGGRDDGGHRTSTITQAQHEALEVLMQALADALQVPLEITDYVKNRSLRDALTAAGEAELIEEQLMNDFAAHQPS